MGKFLDGGNDIRRASNELDVLKHDLEHNLVSTEKVAERMAQIIANTMCLYRVDSAFSEMINNAKEEFGRANTSLYEEALDIMISELQDRKEHFDEYYMPDSDDEMVIK